MNKRITAVLLSSAMALSLCACSETPATSKATEETTTTAAPETTESETSATSEETVTDESKNPSDELQAKVIVDNISVWKQSGEEADLYMYAVTDLDMDGKYEIVKSTTQGTGHYTTAEFWEVEGDKLEKREDNLGEGYFFPELAVTSWNQVLKNEQYKFVLEDFYKGSAVEYGSSIAVIYMEDNVIKCDYVADQHVDVDDDGKENIKYSAGDKEIDEETYNDYKTTGGIKDAEYAARSISWISNVDIEADPGSFISDSLKVFAGY